MSYLLLSNTLQIEIQDFTKDMETVGVSVDPLKALQQTVDEVSSYLNTTAQMDLKTPPATAETTHTQTSKGNRIQII